MDPKPELLSLAAETENFECGATGNCGTLKTDRIITPLISVNSPHREGGFCLERVLGECLRPEL
jgi:hypothetical protein